MTVRGEKFFLEMSAGKNLGERSSRGETVLSPENALIAAAISQSAFSIASAWADLTEGDPFRW